MTSNQRNALREGWQRKSFMFFLKNIKIAANSPTRSCEEERRNNLQGHAQKIGIQ